MKFSFTKNNKIYLFITILLLILSIISIAIWGLKLSIDFKGGTIIEYKLQDIEVEEFREYIDSLADKPKKVFFGNGNFKALYDPLDEENIKAINLSLSEKFPNAIKISSETISSDTGRSQAVSAMTAIFIASAGIVLYLTYTFREVPKPFNSFQFGISAILALLHDALIVIGIFAILGHFWGIEIDLLFVTAILTVIGFSVHDTIVVFDRIREKAMLSRKSREVKLDMSQTIDESLHETLARSIILTLTTVIVLVAMFLLGPVTLKWFIGALLIGMISGTYSSIFVASQLLLLFQSRRIKK
ncbi:protein translocase subunit SecF [bacterium]|nr:MAG: protein translocase subunit SecF [bacterium]